jgi:uncharacterized membrane protein SpoIIM required for sporulation
MSPHPKLVAMRRRTTRIRRVVATLTVSAFVALFSTIYVQMATGNDPVLASTTTNAATTTSTTADPEPAAVTTAQS